jgi:hypothetical protein
MLCSSWSETAQYEEILAEIKIRKSGIKIVEPQSRRVVFLTVYKPKVRESDSKLINLLFGQTKAILASTVNP